MNQKEAYFHLVYEYRSLANAAYAFKVIADKSVSESNQTKQAANTLIPEVGTIIQDSLLLHARTLIEFFYPPNSSRSSDININIFIPTLGNNFKKLKRQIEVHVLHLTAYRDIDYREGKQADIQRPIDWDDVNKTIFSDLIKTLNEFSTRVDEPWRTALLYLKDTAEERFNKGREYDWPSNLGEKENVIKYLSNLNTD